MVTWWGVRLWKSWTVAGEDKGHAEEAVYLIRASDAKEAHEAAEALLLTVNETFENSDGVEVAIAAIGIGSVFNTWEEELEEGMEVFSRLYSLDDDSCITPEWFEGVVDGE